MEIIVVLDHHHVYDSIFKVLEYTELGKVIQFKNYNENLEIIFRSSTFHFQKLNVSFSKDNLYVLNSPIMAAEAWFARRNKIKSIFVEEYFSKSYIKDFIVGNILKQFADFPFISMTKRTNNFLSHLHLSTFLIPPACKKRKGRKNRDIILYVARMVESKNIPFVIEIAKLMKREHFVIIGRGPLFDKFSEISKSMSNLEIIEYVDHEKLFTEYYSKAKVLLHPAFKDPIGFSIIEALSTSTPVLTTNRVGASDYLPSNWLINNYQPISWVNKIKKINLDDYSLAESTFKKEHLDLKDDYFKKISLNLKNKLSV